MPGSHVSLLTSPPATRSVGPAHPIPIGLSGRGRSAPRITSSISSCPSGSASSPHHGAGQVRARSPTPGEVTWFQSGREHRAAGRMLGDEVTQPTRKPLMSNISRRRAEARTVERLRPVMEGRTSRTVVSSVCLRRPEVGSVVVTRARRCRRAEREPTDDARLAVAGARDEHALAELYRRHAGPCLGLGAPGCAGDRTSARKSCRRCSSARGAIRAASIPRAVDAVVPAGPGARTGGRPPAGRVGAPLP